MSTPPNWLYGTWFFTHSNQPLYYTLRNLLWTLAPLEPNDSAYPLPNPILADITSFQHWNTPTDQDPAGGKTFYFYAVDTAVRHVGPDVYHSVPDSRPANLLNNTYEILSWGFDSVGTPFLLLYETRAIDQTGDSLDVVSRAPDGPTKATMLQIAKGVHSLNDSAVSALWEKVGKLRQDSEREGLPWPLCNETCMTGGEYLFFTFIPLTVPFPSQDVTVPDLLND